METLAFFAGTVGAGYAGSQLFEALRYLLLPPAVAPTNRLVVAGYWLLWSPRGARITVLALAAIISMVFSLILAALNGELLLPAALMSLDRALGAGGMSQLLHASHLSTRTKTKQEVG